MFRKRQILFYIVLCTNLTIVLAVKNRDCLKRIFFPDPYSWATKTEVENELSTIIEALNQGNIDYIQNMYDCNAAMYLLTGETPFDATAQRDKERLISDGLQNLSACSVLKCFVQDVPQTIGPMRDMRENMITLKLTFGDGREEEALLSLCKKKRKMVIKSFSIFNEKNPMTPIYEQQKQMIEKSEEKKRLKESNRL